MSYLFSSVDNYVDGSSSESNYICVNKVWEMEWDMSGMTLATTGGDGVVRLWQSNLNGAWHEQAVLAPPS